MVHKTRFAPLLPALLLVASVPCFGQIMTAGGDPVLEVTDPAKVVPSSTQTKTKTPPLTAGQRVRLVQKNAGTARIATQPANPGDPSIEYRIPAAALRPVAGKTHTERPGWLPSPAAAETAARDVLAYRDSDDWITVRIGGAKPVRLAKGQDPAVSPDGSRLAYTPKDRTGLALVDLTNNNKTIRLVQDRPEILEKSFSPDGKSLVWRANNRLERLDLTHPQATPAFVRALDSDKSLQGFTHDGAALVVQDLQQVTWIGLDGATLREAPLAQFTDDPWGSSADHYIPSPINPDLLLIERSVIGTPAFERWAHDTSAALYLYDAASQTNFRLTSRSLTAVNPAWTPDGRRIYFAGLSDTPPNGQHRIYRMNADGTGLKEIAKGWQISVGTRP